MLWNLIKKTYQENAIVRKQYFTNQKDEILTTNLHIYRYLTVFVCISFLLYTIFLTLTTNRWHVTPLNIILYICIFLHIPLSGYINMHRLKNHFLERLAVIVFSDTVFLLLIAMDTISAPNTNQVFCASFLVVAPAMLIMPFSRMLIDQVFFVIVYAIFAYTVKDPSIARNDMFAIWAGFIFGLILYEITMDLRIKVNAQVLSFRHFSETDELTKIKNRRAVNAQIAYTLSHKPDDTSCALMILDVDFFKTINDTCGHQAGDRVLTGVASALSRAFRKTDVVSRYGGDEFLVYLQGFQKVDFMETKCKEIQANIQAIENGDHPVSVSIGVAILTQGASTEEELLHEADAALYETKERQRGTSTFHILPDHIIKLNL